MNQQPISPTASDFSSDMLDHDPFDALLTVTQYALGSAQRSRRLDLVLNQYLYIECEWRPFSVNVENFIEQLGPFEEKVTNGNQRNDLQGFTVVDGSDTEDTIAGHVSRTVKERPQGRLVFVDIPIGLGMKCLIFLACLWGWQVDFYTRDVALVAEFELRWAFPRLVCCVLLPEFRNVEPVAINDGMNVNMDVGTGEP